MVPPVTPPAAGTTIDTSAWFTNAPTTWRDAFVEALPEPDRAAGKSFFERAPSLPVLANNYVQAQKRLSSGLPPENVPYLPKDATPEQLAAYRKAVDVPEKSDAYALALDEGLVLSDDDKKFFTPVFATMHAANMPTAVVSSVVNEYLKLDQRMQKDIAVKDDHDKQETMLALSKVWGVDRDRNLGLVQMFLQDLPEDTRKAFEGARMADGTAVFNSPAILQFLLGKQREINPMAMVVPQGGSDGVKAIETEMKALEAEMGSEAWYKDEKKQARYRELVSAQERLQQKAQQ